MDSSICGERGAIKIGVDAAKAVGGTETFNSYGDIVDNGGEGTASGTNGVSETVEKGGRGAGGASDGDGGQRESGRQDLLEGCV